MSTSQVFSDAYRQWVESYMHIFKTWMEAYGRISEESKTHSVEEFFPSTSSKFYEFTLGQFQNWIGQITGIPQFGPMKTYYSFPAEIQERGLKSLEAYVNFYKDWLDLTSRLHGGWIAAWTKLGEKAANLIKEAPSPEAHRKLYGIWVETFEKEFDALFKEPKFAASLGRMMNSTLEWRRQNKEIVEAYLRFIGVPAKADIDEVYRELNQLRREIKNLSSRIEELPKKSAPGES